MSVLISTSCVAVVSVRVHLLLYTYALIWLWILTDVVKLPKIQVNWTGEGLSTYNNICNEVDDISPFVFFQHLVMLNNNFANQHTLKYILQRGTRTHVMFQYFLSAVKFSFYRSQTTHTTKVLCRSIYKTRKVLVFSSIQLFKTIAIKNGCRQAA